MKHRILGLAVLLVLFLGTAIGQTATRHQAVLTWTAPSDADTTTVYSVYRQNAVCPLSGLGTGTWTKLQAGVTALTYTDATITVGNWCYYVQPNTQGIDAVPSNTSGGQAKPNTTTVTIVIQ